MHKVVYTKKADKDLEKLDPQISKRIVEKIGEYELTSDPLRFAKRLTNSPLGHFRFRIGDYRAIFDIDENNNIKILLILTIGHRKDIYID